MANNDEMIYKGKALKDLRGIKDVLQSQGDPFLANIMNRAIECIENQPAVEAVQVVHGKAVHIPANLDSRDTLIQMDRLCSECGALITKMDRYCPNCGAHMDQEE